MTLFSDIYIVRRPLILGLLIYCVLLGAVKTSGFFDRLPPRDPAHWNGRRCVITGRVSGQPDVRPKGCVYTLDVETVRALDDFGDESSVAGRALIQINGADGDFAAPGDRLRAIGLLQAPANARVPGAFNYRAFLSNRGVHAMMYSGVNSVINTGPSDEEPLGRLGWAMKSRAMRLFRARLSPESATVMGGMVVGERPRFHPDVKRIFQESGTMHILVASGSNVGFVMGFWFLFARIVLRWRRRAALAGGLPFAWTYALLVGADPPIVRAAVMTTLAVTAYWIAREDNHFHTLAAAALALLLINPSALFEVGFQMSFLTVFGLIYWLPRVEPWLESLSLWTRWALRLAAATVTAQVWLFPITANVFRKFYPVSVAANIFVLPASALGLPMGLLLIAGELSPSGNLFANVVERYARGIIYLVRFFADHAGRTVWVAPLSTTAIVGFYAACLAVPFLKNWKGRGVFAGGLLLVASSFLSLTEKPSFSMTWIDVGRTLAVLIQTDGGKTILINPGAAAPFDSNERLLLPFLSEQGVFKLDAALSTQKPDKAEPALEALAKTIEVSTTAVLSPRKKFSLGGVEIFALPAAASIRDCPLLITASSKTIVLGTLIPVETQDYLLRRRVQVNVLQGRFSPKIIWLDDFIRGLKPDVVVEAATRNTRSGVQAPWADRPPVFPQELGWWRWPAQK